jgi:DNA-binding response OmpR family regulator
MNVAALLLVYTKNQGLAFALDLEKSPRGTCVARLLRFRGYVYYTQRLDAALQFDSFDAYVVDWVLPSGTAEALVARLRNQSASCPIALLTGKAGTKDVDEKDLVAAIEQHGLLFLQKPVTASIAASQFSAAFANR